METKKETKEMDLIDVLKACWNWFVKYIWNSIVFLIRFCLKKWWVGVLAVVIGLAASYCDSRFCPKYTATAIFRNNVCSSSDFINDVRTISKTSAAYKAELLGIPFEEAKELKGFWAHSLCYMDTLKLGYGIDMDDQLVASGYVPITNLFCVEIAARDINAFNNVEQGIVNYFNKNNFYVQQNNARLESLEASSEMFKAESEQLSLSREKTGDRGGLMTLDLQTGGSVPAMLNPAAYSSEIIKFTDASLTSKTIIKYSPDVVAVVTPLRIDGVPENFYLFTWGKYVGFSLLIFYLIALCCCYCGKIKRFVLGE